MGDETGQKHQLQCFYPVYPVYMPCLHRLSSKLSNEEASSEALRKAKAKTERDLAAAQEQAKADLDAQRQQYEALLQKAKLDQVRKGAWSYGQQLDLVGMEAGVDGAMWTGLRCMDIGGT